MSTTRTPSITNFWKYAIHAATGFMVAATVAALSAGPSLAGAPSVLPMVTVNEAPGEYTASISDTSPSIDWFLVMFAVGNPTAGNANTPNAGWEADSFTGSQWDTGQELSFGINTMDLGFGDMFDDIFGPGAIFANTYWATNQGAWIGPNDSLGNFFFGGAPASEWVAVVSDEQGQQQLFGTAQASIAEPAALGLFGLGLAGLAYARRRRKMKA